MMSIEHTLLLEKNEKMSSDVHVLTFSANDIPKAVPGQFFELKSPYFLRRPIGVMRQSETDISFGIKVVGKGTSALCELRPGDQVSALGPLGRGFDFRHIAEEGRIILIGGGTGIFPLFYLAESLRDCKSKNKVSQIFGFRSAKECFLEEELRNLRGETILASDSGGLDFHGHVVGALESFLAERNEKPLAFFCCGPEAMLKAVTDIGRREEIPVQVSLETRMGCGIGLCRGCAVDLKDERRESGFRRVRCCKEGPVFPGEKVIWS